MATATFSESTADPTGMRTHSSARASAAAESPAPSDPTSSAIAADCRIRSLAASSSLVPASGVAATSVKPRARRSSSASGHGSSFERQRQRRRHRGPNRLAIERIGAAGPQQHRAHAKCQRRSEDAADVVWIADVVEHDYRAPVRRAISRREAALQIELPPRHRLGAFGIGQATLMKLEAAGRREFFSTEDLEGRSPISRHRVKRVAQSCLSRRRHEQAGDTPARMRERPRDDDSAFECDQSTILTHD